MPIKKKKSATKSTKTISKIEREIILKQIMIDHWKDKFPFAPKVHYKSYLITAKDSKLKGESFGYSLIVRKGGKLIGSIIYRDDLPYPKNWTVKA